MAFQTDNLVMLGLGVQNNQPPNSIQPALATGIHLRFQSKRALGFPWYGYYLLRRESLRTNPLCLANSLIFSPPNLTVGSAASPEPAPSTEWSTPVGIFTSKKNLVFTDDFAPTGQKELDLSSGLGIDLLQGKPAKRITMQIGLRAPAGTSRYAIDFKADPGKPQVLSNPYTTQGVTFLGLDAGGAKVPQLVILPDGIVPSGLNAAGPSLTEQPSSAGQSSLAAQPSPAGQPGQLLMTLPADAAGAQVNLNWVSAEIKLEFLQDGTWFLHPTPAGIASAVEFGFGSSGSQVRLTSSAMERTVVPHVYVDLKTPLPPIRVRALSGVAVVAEKTIGGDKGSIANLVFESDQITAIEIDEGDAALIDLCVELVGDGITNGWEPLAGPIGLPVKESQYPLTNLDPTALIQSRVKYGDPVEATNRLKDLAALLGPLVQGGPSGPAMTTVSLKLTAVDDVSPVTRRSPLDLLLMASLHPAVAQVLGLYYVDQTARDAIAYDYMVVADHTGVGAKDPAVILSLVTQRKFSEIEAYAIFNKRVAPAPPLDPPTGAKVFALPGTGPLPDGSSTESAALTWDLPRTAADNMLPEQPFLFHVWRAPRGNSNQPSTNPGAYQAVTYQVSPRKDHPVLVSPFLLPGGTLPKRPANWPPPSIPLNFVDRPGTDGWYSYQVNAVNLFGQHSKNSGDVPWYQWVPEPDPSPWYYRKGAGAQQLDSQAVDLRNKIPPPPPTAVEASLLDLQDPFVVQDGRYLAWRAAVPGLAGLRARWTWTVRHMRQAPGTQEFRLYWNPDTNPPVNADDAVWWQQRMLVVDYNPSSPNDILTAVDSAGKKLEGLIANVSAAAVSLTGNPDLSTLQTQTPPPSELVVGGECLVFDNDPSTLCRIVSVNKSTGQLTIDILRTPANGLKCRIVYPILKEDLIPASDPSGNPLEHLDASVSGTVVTLPPSVDLSNLRAAGEVLIFESDTRTRYRIEGVNPITKAVRLPSTSNPPSVPNLKCRVAYPIRTYEVFLPGPADTPKQPVPLTASLTKPVVYANVALTAADGALDTSDNIKWNGTKWGNREGNEGKTSNAVRVVRVLRETPAPPEIAGVDERVYATRADYAGNSFCTVRWRRVTDTKTHLFRALDDAVFQQDWRIRSTRFFLFLPANKKLHASYFPAEWTDPQRAQVAQRLNSIIDPAGYATLSADDLKVLKKLPGNLGLEGQALFDNDFLLRNVRRALTVTVIDDKYFPAALPDATLRGPVVLALNNIASFDDYDKLTDRALRVLAGLPGNEEVFQQITIRPLDPSLNVKGPEDPDAYIPDPALCAHIDTLPGKGRNRYFYRGVFIDGANNRSQLSLAGPPLYLPTVVPPRAPVITEILGGDRQITIQWAANREPDLAEYRVYRAEGGDAATELRQMTLLLTRKLDQWPSLPKAGVSWADMSVQAGVKYLYRVAAVDLSGNLAASKTVSAQAYDLLPPESPTWISAIRDSSGTIDLQWLARPPCRTLVERHLADGPWYAVSGWLDPGIDSFRDSTADSTTLYGYRLRVQNQVGTLNIHFNEITVPQ